MLCLKAELNKLYVFVSLECVFLFILKEFRLKLYDGGLSVQRHM